MKDILEEKFEEHLVKDEKFQDKINAVLFGNDINQKGMVDKVDEMHNILVSAQNVKGFFGGVKGVLAWLIILGAFVALVKGWLGGLVIYLTAAK